MVVVFKITYNKWFIIFVITLLAGCNPSARFTWITKWLDEPTCQPPCWENLHPGTTLINEVPNILAKVPDIINISDSAYSGFVECKSWSMNGYEKKEIGLACKNKYDEKPISTIELKFGFNPGSRVYLGEIINSYGNPNYVVPKIDNAGCHAYIFYIEKGMRLFVDGSSPGKMMKITGNWEVLNVTFYYPENDIDTTLDSLGWKGFLDLTRMRKWSGYTDYPCYN
jgi:hypothetical protein